MKKRLMAMILAICMLVSLAPTVLATDSAVAKIEETEYTTLQAAIDAAQSGDTVTVLKNVTLSAQEFTYANYNNRLGYCGLLIPDGKNIVLDLNGKTISYTDTYGDYDNCMIINLGNLTINDSANDGKITYTPAQGTKSGTYLYATILNAGKLTVNAVTLENAADYSTNTKIWDCAAVIDNNSHLSYTYENDVSCTINEGATLDSKEYYAIRLFTHYLTGYRNDLVINGGTVTGIYMQHGDTWYYPNEIDGRLAHGSLTINGGTVTSVTASDGYDYIAVNMSLYNPDNSNWDMDITGGTIEEVKVRVQKGTYYINGDSGETTKEKTGASNQAWLTKVGGVISGGTFMKKIDENYLAEEYTLEDNGDDTYTVKAKDYSVTFETTPAGTAIVVTDAADKEISAENDGTYKLSNGTYTYTVTKDGYVTETNSFTVKGEDLSIAVTLELATYAVSIEIPAGAAIVVTDAADKEISADDDGTYKLSNGTYTYTVTKEGYVTKTGSFTVADEAFGFTVTLEAVTYAVTIQKAENGSITANPATASAGKTVTITVAPDKGYELEEITVTDQSGKELALTKTDAGAYTFTMPASKVTVTATFMDDNTILNYFVDVPTDSYYTQPVMWAIANDITMGTSETTFSPNANCKRGQIVTFLWRAAGEPEPQMTTCPFTDVKAGAYYYDAILWAVENGITTGTSATTFSPDEDCTRGQIVMFLWRAADEPESRTATCPFVDVKADAYYYNAVLWAVESEITNGTSKTTFSPEDDCTRAHAVTFLYRMYQ